MDASSETVLAIALWKRYTSVWSDFVGGAFLYDYQGAAANGASGVGEMSAVATGEGGVDQGLQYLNVYSDYGNTGAHDAGQIIDVNIFQERIIVSDDIGSTLTFSADFKSPSTGGIADTVSATANAFIVTLDPGAGYARTNNVRFDTTTADPNNWGSFSIEISLADPALAGQILQFGFNNTATNYDPSGVFYDNLSLAPRTVDVTDYATLKFAFDASGVTGTPFADMELRMEDANSGGASVYLSDYSPTLANPPVTGADWQLYEIPLADFTGTLDKSIMKSLTFADPSSTVSKPPGVVTPLEGAIRTDDFYFIETP